MDERQIVALFWKGVDGDSVAYREFLLQLHSHLRVYVCRQLSRLKLPDADADDIVQEALIAVDAKRHTYDGSTQLFAWAHAIARYKLIDSLRSANRLGVADSLDALEDVVEENGRSDARITVRRILALLPDQFRIPIELMKLEGFSASEIARRTGASEVGVRVSVHRGLARLSRICAGSKRDPDAD